MKNKYKLKPTLRPYSPFEPTERVLVATYQADEAEAPVSVDEDLADVPVLGEHALELVLRDVHRQVPDEETRALGERLLAGLPKARDVQGHLCPASLAPFPVSFRLLGRGGGLLLPLRRRRRRGAVFVRRRLLRGRGLGPAFRRWR